MATIAKLITAEEFWLLPETDGRRSLVRGVVEETMPTNLEHAFIAAAFSDYLRQWARATNAGRVGVEGGFILARDPDIVRSPDAFFIRRERIDQTETFANFGDFAPDLAIEIVSPSESAQEIHEKVRDYLAAGTALVWVAYPTTRTVIAHTPDGIARTFRETDTLTAPDVLPGFSRQVADLFA